MEAKKATIENWPKETGLQKLQKWLTLLIALFALIAAITAVYISRETLIASHRPYVRANSMAVEKNGKRVQDANTIIILCMNTPAQITKAEYSYITIKKDDNGTHCRNSIYRYTLPAGFLVYPSMEEQTTFTLRSLFEKELVGLWDNPKTELLRKVRIDYKELSSKREYYFEAEWEYDREANQWRPGPMFGN